MSLYDYRKSRILRGEPFYALLMAAAAQADTENAAKIQAAWPDMWAELQARYHAGAGVLPGEPGYEDIHRRRQATGLDA